MKIDLMDMPLWLKFTIAAIYDIIDLFSLPGFGQLYDVIGVPLGFALWGPIGMANLWEVFDPLDVTDRFVPTMVITGVLSVLWSK